MAADFEEDVDIPEEAIEIFDGNVLKALPPGTKGKAIDALDGSFWTRAAQLSTTSPDGDASYFLKVSIGQRGKEMIFGEFESMKTIYSVIPDLTPRPIAWGTYSSDPDIHFFLTKFHEISDDLPHIQRFTSRVANMHMNGKSPNGKYGFPVTTFNGNLPQDNSWTDTWEEFYKQSMRRMLQFEEETQGPSQELTNLCGPLFDKVIPRLLRPLETGGNHIEPCLVHGDLWYANVYTDVVTDTPLVYSPCCFYAHNEYELGVWRPVRSKLGRPYVKAYQKVFPVSAPEEDHDDRNALYSISFNLNASALYSGNKRFRSMVIDEVRRLVDKYPGGFEAWEADSPKIPKLVWRSSDLGLSA